MCKQKIIIFGVGVTADIVYDSIINDMEADIEVSAFCVDKEYYCMTSKYSLPVVKFQEVQKHYSPQEYKMIVAMGYQKLNLQRTQKCHEAEEKGYQLSGFVHSMADVSWSVRDKIGKNSIIVNNVSIGPEAVIGDNVGIFAGAVISHHAVIEDNVWIAPGTVICGKTVVGANSFIGANSMLGDNITVGKNNFIGAGAVVTKDTENDSVYIIPNTPKYILKSDQFIHMFGI